MKLPLSVPLPCVPFGHDTYKEGIEQLMRLVPAGRYVCDSIKSPIDEKKRHRDRVLVRGREVRQKLAIPVQRKRQIEERLRELQRSM